jgi:hypothetical protein
MKQMTFGTATGFEKRQKILRRAQLLAEINRTKPKVRAMVEHPFLTIKQGFKFAKVCYQGLALECASVFCSLRAGQSLWHAPCVDTRRLERCVGGETNYPESRGNRSYFA